MAEETSGSIGTARIDVTVNTATMEAGVEAAKRRVSGLGTEAEAQFNKASASGKRYADSLLRQAEMLGKTRAEQIAYNAQTRIGGELGDKIAAKALAQQAAMSAGMAATGKSAKELAFAMRQVPAQITDIVTGLASGQRPMMVLLQQGGQLKDVFGGIKPAAAALGRSLLGLINPFTVAAAAAAGLVVAWKQGSDEAVAYNKALISTGNYASVTADRMGQLADRISDTTDATQHAAADVLAQVAASGKFTGQQLEEVGRAALAMSAMTGQATEETIRQFEDIGKKPVEAITKLNDSQHFLTLAVYEQIKALEDQGRTQDAAALAMKAYSDSLKDRAKEVEENAGLMERAWHAVAGAAKGAWDAMLNVGREKSLGDQAQALQQQIETLKIGTILPNGTYRAGLTEDSPEIKALRQQISDIYTKAEEQSRQARVQAAQAQVVQNKVDADRAASKAGISSGGRDPFSDSIGNDPRADLTASIGKEISAYKAEADQWARSTSAAVAYRQTLADMLDTRQRAIDLQVASIGMGQREIDQQQALIAIDEDYNRKKADLQKRQQNTTSALEREGYTQQLDDLEDYHKQRVQMEIDGWKRAEEARKSAALGARAAIKDFEDAAGDVAGQTYDVFSNAFDGMTDAIAKFVQTGKLDFSELATSIIADLAKMEARILVSQALQSIFGGSTSTISGYDSATPQQQVAYDVAHGYANGGVFANSPSLSAYSGGIYDKPHLFAFARGAGVFGEAGPEAIMPLRRGPDGKLGVAAAGGGGGDVQVEVNITNNGQAVQAKQTGTRRDGQKVIVDMVLEAVAGDIASGGKTAKAMQQRFGVQRRGVPVGG